MMKLSDYRLFVRNPVPLPWFISDRLNPSAQRLLNQLYLRELNDIGNPSIPLKIFIVLAWIVIMARQCVIKYRQNYAKVKVTAPELGPIKHCLYLLVCVFQNNIPPTEFYAFKLFLPKKFALRREILVRWQLDTLLQDSLPPPELRILNHKFKFWNKMAQAGIPAAKVIAQIKDGQWGKGDKSILNQIKDDLVVKPTSFGKGDGIVFVDRVGNNEWRWEEEILTQESLVTKLESYSRQTELIIQPRLENHSAFRDFETKGLVTVRIVTISTPEEPKPIVFGAHIRIPKPGGRLASFAQGSLLARINLASGTLGPAVKLVGKDEPLDADPITNTPVTGFIVPFWDQCVKICLSAHVLEPNLNSAGWDIGICEDGPQLLECNFRWCGKGMQIAGGAPLLETSFPSLYRRYVPAPNR